MNINKILLFFTFAFSFEAKDKKKKIIDDCKAYCHKAVCFTKQKVIDTSVKSYTLAKKYSSLYANHVKNGVITVFEKIAGFVKNKLNSVKKDETTDMIKEVNKGDEDADMEHKEDDEGFDDMDLQKFLDLFAQLQSQFKNEQADGAHEGHGHEDEEDAENDDENEKQDEQEDISQVIEEVPSEVAQEEL